MGIGNVLDNWGHDRDLLCYWAAVELGMAMVDPARRLDITPAAVSYAVQRGEKIARESGYGLGALNLRHTRLLQR